MPNILAQGLRNLPKEQQAELALYDSPKNYINNKANEIAKQLRNNYGIDSIERNINIRDLDAMAGGNLASNKATNRAEYSKKLKQVALDWMPFAIGHIAYHGSPHKFDKFDMSKIGTGEGAQAYGHGLYFAESPDVAKSYQTTKDLNAGKLIAGGKEITPSAPHELKALNAVRGEAHYSQGANPIDNAIKYFKDNSGAFSSKEANDANNASLEYLQGLKKSGAEFQADGSIYKVDIPDEAVARMLDWDKPVSESLRKPASEAAMKQWESGLSGTSGEHLYNEVVKNFEWAGSKNPKDDAIKWLNQQGIPGIRYLDGGSRGAGQGSSNFVVFDDEMPRILEINGQPTGALPWSPGEWGGAAKQVPKTEFELAHEVAQRNAALPVEQGGLGLPANNTAMDRARAMGFDTPAYHGTHADIKEFMPNKALGSSVFTAPTPEGANQFAYANQANVIPLLTNQSNFLGGKVVHASNEVKKAKSAQKAGKSGYLVTDSYIPKPEEINSAFVDPSAIRSRFAAFDPMRRNEANLLAGIGAAGVGLGVYGYNQPKDEWK